MVNFRLRNDDGSAGGLAGFLMLVGIVGIMVAVLSPIPDALNSGLNTQIGGGMPVSQDRMDTQMNLSIAFEFAPFLLAFAFGINLWINSMNEQDQAV